MEGEAASSVAVYMEYMESPALVERLTTSAPVGQIRVQESNIDRATRASFNDPCPAKSESPSPTSQYPSSELPTLIPRDESSIRLVPHEECTEQHPKSTFGTSIQFKCGSWKTGLEVGVLTGIVIMVRTLFSIPTILYALPPKIRESETNPTGGGVVPSTSSCDQKMVYEGQVCLSELTQWQKCFSPLSNAVYVPSNTEAEATASFLLSNLPLLSPSPECEVAIRPFLCLYLFGSCDADNNLHGVTQASCVRLRDDVCAQEFILAEGIVGQGVLPDCDDLLQQEEECQDGENSTSLNMTNMISEVANRSAIICTEGYYLSSDNLCRPLCTLWVNPPGVGLDSDNIAVIVSAIIAVISSIIVIVLALTIQRSTMLTFPTTYLIYCCTTIAITERSSFAPLKTYLKVFKMKQPIALQEVFSSRMVRHSWDSYWVAFHAISLCWAIVFPFHYRRMKMQGKLKYFHIVTVLIALLFPTLPALINLHDGYTMADTPTTICIGRNVDVIFFALVLPLCVLIAVAASALIIMFWKILKEFVLKKLFDRKRGFILKRGTQTTPNIGKAQAKILLIMCYYIAVGTIVLTLFTYYQVAGEADIQAVTSHFACQSAGTQSGRDCGDVPNIHLELFDSLTALGIILTGLLPAVVLIFTVKCNRNNKCCK